MSLRVGARARKALFFAREQNEADRAPGLNSGGLDGAQSVHNQRGVAAVVESARAEFPGIEMRANDNELVGQFTAAKFANYIRSLDRASELIRNGQIRPYEIPGGEQAGHAFAVFASDDHHRQLVDFSGYRVRVAVKNVVLACRHEGNRFDLRL